VSQIDESDVRRYSVVRIADETVVDLMASACGITYEDAATGERARVKTALLGTAVWTRWRGQ